MRGGYVQRPCCDTRTLEVEPRRRQRRSVTPRGRTGSGDHARAVARGPAVHHLSLAEEARRIFQLRGAPRPGRDQRESNELSTTTIPYAHGRPPWSSAARPAVP